MKTSKYINTKQKKKRRKKKKSDSWVANSARCIYMSVARQNSDWQSHRRREDSITQQKGKKQQREGNTKKKKRALPALFFERPTARKTKEKVTLRNAAARAVPVPRLTPTPKYSSCSCCVRFLHPPGPHTHI